MATHIYDSWLSVLLYVSTEGSKVVLSAPTRFIKEWILVHYLDQILKYWQDEDQSICSVDICVIIIRMLIYWWMSKIG